MTILIVTDNPALNIGLRTIIIGEFPDITILEAETLQKTLNSAPSAGMMILDAGVPDAKDMTLLDTFMKTHPQTAVVLYLSDAFEYIYAFARAGIIALISRKSDAVEIAEALHSASEGVRYISFDIQQRLLSHLAGGPESRELSRKERLVADLLLANKTNRDISLIAEIEPRALAHLKRRIFQKLEVQSLSELGVKLGRGGGEY